MNEHGIIMQPDSGRAIIDGSKTQTRRVVTDGNSQGNYRASELYLDRAWVDSGPSPAGNPGPYLKAPVNYMAAQPRLRRHGWTEEDARRATEDGIVERLYPRTFPGDRLWVRETHAVVPRTAYARSEGVQQTINPLDSDTAVVYRAGWERSAPGRWRPSIFMPRWASRITLEVTEVRLERVQEITEEDARAEGVVPVPCEPASVVFGTWKARHRHRDAFAALWDSINARRGFGWDENPWVWVVGFRRITP